MAKEIQWSRFLAPDSNPALGEQMGLVVRLSIPIILAEISSTVMSYVDSAMVGSLGAAATASVGLVASSTWLFSGMGMCMVTGFSIQIAQLIGAGRLRQVQSVMRQAMMVSVGVGLLFAAIAAAVSGKLPVWLGGAPEVCAGSSRYFFIYGCGLPVVLLRQAGGSMLQCSGDMKTPSALNILMCCMNVVFNAFFIFPTRVVTLLGMDLTIFGVGMGVAGAALGTVMSETVTTILMMYFVCLRSPVLKLVKGVPWRLEQNCMMTTVRLAVPIALERVTTSLAQIAGTKIVSPLGTTAVAANSLAVTAEGFCYMPGYGMAAAATTLVGQSMGAERRDQAKRFAWLSVALGVGVMTCTGILMYIAAPWIFSMLTPDAGVRTLGAQVLRIEAFAEPLFAASIVAAGALRGAGDTLVPSVMELGSMWGVRITLAMLLVGPFGLHGVWMAMCTELCVRGLLFLVRMYRGKWLEIRTISAE
ncbi:MAG: MATE family efflux transporter [Oscillospiraceae bacterium]|jgi:putative MATE family efflux protein|nr:MATE family efflux transporter [Oscillospiraceae bacterium]